MMRGDDVIAVELVHPIFLHMPPPTEISISGTVPREQTFHSWMLFLQGSEQYEAKNSSERRSAVRPASLFKSN